MSYDKANPNNKPMFTHVDFSWAVLSIFDKSCWIYMQYPKFLACQNDARAVFLEGQNGAF